MTLLNETQLDKIADALVGRGYLIMDDLLSEDMLAALLQHFNRLREHEFLSAGIGRQADFQVQGSVRSDKICWIKSDTQVTAEFLLSMEALRRGINRRLFLGLCDYESHFAHYPVGAFYKKHVDVFREKNSTLQHNGYNSSLLQTHPKRVVSTVVYLNENWQADSGGELLLYSENEEQVLEKISPEFGRVVIFLSEKFPHEVLPATSKRNSIAGWFRVND